MRRSRLSRQHFYDLLIFLRQNRRIRILFVEGLSDGGRLLQERPGVFREMIEICTAAQKIISVRQCVPVCGRRRFLYNLFVYTDTFLKQFAGPDVLLFLMSQRGKIVVNSGEIRLCPQAHVRLGDFFSEKEAFLIEVFGSREVAVLLVQAGCLSVRHGEHAPIVDLLRQSGEFFTGGNAFYAVCKGVGKSSLFRARVGQKREVVRLTVQNIPVVSQGLGQFLIDEYRPDKGLLRFCVFALLFSEGSEMIVQCGQELLLSGRCGGAVRREQGKTVPQNILRGLILLLMQIQQEEPAGGGAEGKGAVLLLRKMR